MLLFIGIYSLDQCQEPENKISIKLYIKAVRIYQNYFRPLTQDYVKCRFVPSCSEYSIDAVKKYGIIKGFGLSVKRISSCTSDVPMYTIDTVK